MDWLPRNEAYGLQLNHQGSCFCLIPLTAGSIGLRLRQVCIGALCSNPERPHSVFP